MESSTVPSATSHPKLSMKESSIWIVPESAIVKSIKGTLEGVGTDSYAEGRSASWEQYPMQE